MTEWGVKRGNVLSSCLHVIDALTIFLFSASERHARSAIWNLQQTSDLTWWTTNVVLALIYHLDHLIRRMSEIIYNFYRALVQCAVECNIKRETWFVLLIYSLHEKQRFKIKCHRWKVSGLFRFLTTKDRKILIL